MSMRLIVIIRDVQPLIHFGDPVEHKHVVVELTPEQEQQLTLRWCGKNMGADIYEQLATCFLEGEPPREEVPTQYRS